MRSDAQEILLPWDDIDTILLDMDGTILDLNYDNHVWNQALPSAYAEKHSINEEAAPVSYTHLTLPTTPYV